MQNTIKTRCLTTIGTTGIVLLLMVIFYSPTTLASTYQPDDRDIHIIVYSGNDEQVTLWLDCSKHSAVFWQYRVGKDSGDAERSNRFLPDPDVDPKCQPPSNAPYGKPYHRGHIFGANFGDNDTQLIKKTNYWPNILPQHSTFNLSGYRHIERVIECRRENEDVIVTGGVFPSEPPIAHIHSHDTPVPAYIWLVVQGVISGDSFSMIIPNGPSATKKSLSKYLVPQRQIDTRWGERISLPIMIDRESVGNVWKQTQCNQS